MGECVSEEGRVGGWGGVWVYVSVCMGVLVCVGCTGVCVCGCAGVCWVCRVYIYVCVCDI